MQPNAFLLCLQDTQLASARSVRDKQVPQIQSAVEGLCFATCGVFCRSMPANVGQQRRARLPPSSLTSYLSTCSSHLFTSAPLPPLWRLGCGDSHQHAPQRGKRGGRRAAGERECAELGWATEAERKTAGACNGVSWTFISCIRSCTNTVIKLIY